MKETILYGVMAWAGLALITALLVLGISFFFLFHAAANPNLSTGKRAAWSAAMLLCAPLPQFFYGLSTAASRSCRNLTVLAVVMIAVTVAGGAYVIFGLAGVEDFGQLKSLKFPQTPQQLEEVLQREGVDQASSISMKLEKADLRELSQADRDQLQMRLGALQLRLQDKNLLSDQRAGVELQLRNLNDALGDRQLTRQEYSDWIFNSQTAAGPIGGGL